MYNSFLSFHSFVLQACVCVSGHRIPEQTGKTPASTLVIEAGVNGMKNQRSEELKEDFTHLVDTLLVTGKQVVVCGPLPPPCFGNIKFSRLHQLHAWQKGYCMHKGIPFVDHFAAFLNRPLLFKRDGLHLNMEGSRFLASSIKLTLHSCSK